MEFNWSQHLMDTVAYAPSSLLVKALAHVARRDRAIDIGCGALRDTRYLLEQGFEEVTALDQEPGVAALAEALHSSRIRCVISSFVDFVFPQGSFDLICAMRSLPFVPPHECEATIEKIKQALVAGGIFCAHFFGPRDGWSDRDHMTFHTKEQLMELFQDMSILLLDEQEFNGTLADGTPKRWHVFNVIAKNEDRSP
jgi:tellurite methyltransferase